MNSSKENKSSTSVSDSTGGARFNSVEADQELANRYELLRNHVSAQALLERKIEDYWGSDDIRAPFIEALTVRELLSLSVENLLKKKNFREAKIIGLISALDRLLADPAPKDVGTLSHSSSPQTVIPSLPVSWAQWEPQSEVSASRLDRWIAARSFFYREESSSAWILGEFLRSICSLANPEELLSLLEPEGSQSVKKDLKEYFESNHSDLLQWFSRSLKGVGASEKALLFPLAYPKGDVAQSYFPHLPLSCLHIILAILGAQHPKLGEESLVEVWTTEPESFSHVLIAARAHESPEKRLETLQALAPQFPLEVLNRCAQL